MREIRKFIKSISGHKNFDPNYYSSEVLTMTNSIYSLFNSVFIFERQKKNGFWANKYRSFWGKIRGVVFDQVYITTTDNSIFIPVQLLYQCNRFKWPFHKRFLYHLRLICRLSLQKSHLVAIWSIYKRAWTRVRQSPSNYCLFLSWISNVSVGDNDIGDIVM